MGALSSKDAQPLATKGKIQRSKVVVRDHRSCERLEKTHWLMFIQTLSVSGHFSGLYSLWASGSREVYLGGGCLRRETSWERNMSELGNLPGEEGGAYIGRGIPK